MLRLISGRIRRTWHAPKRLLWLRLLADPEQKTLSSIASRERRPHANGRADDVAAQEGDGRASSSEVPVAPCTGTGPTPPHPHRDWAHPYPTQEGNGLACALVGHRPGPPSRAEPSSVAQCQHVRKRPPDDARLYARSGVPGPRRRRRRASCHAACSGGPAPSKRPPAVRVPNRPARDSPSP